MNSHVRLIKSLSMVHQTCCETIDCEDQVTSCVSRLSSTSAPKTVTRLVISVVILTFNCQIERTFSHVGKGSLKGFQPSLANLYSASSIIAKYGILWIHAA